MARVERVTHLFVCDEVCLFKQLLLVMLEFSDHVCEFAMMLFAEKKSVAGAKDG